MHNTIRRSPVHASLTALDPVWREVGQMAVAWQVASPEAEAGRLQQLAVADASCFNRFGVKGPQAAAWLLGQGVPVPEAANHWVPLPGGGAVMRLGSSEFFVEDPIGATVPGLRSTLGLGLPGVYAVARQDAALILAGARIEELLLQVCGVNFRAVTRDPSVVVMTSMAGVGVVVIRQPQGGQDRIRLWCDPSFGPYLWQTLTGISEELGGGAVGLGCLHAHLS